MIDMDMGAHKDMENIAISVRAKNMRKHALDMALSAGASAAHFGGGMSIVDILAVLYFGVMDVSSREPLRGERDRFILSKGHGVLGYYAALREAGFLSEKEIATFEKDDTILAGHPVINKAKGIEFTNGSLGQGLSLGIGVSLAMKKKCVPNDVYVLMGDGECNEGSVWEAFMAGAHFRLDNLTVIIDRNGYQLGGANDSVMSLLSLKEKLSSFGWDVCECDGHNYDELLGVLRKHEQVVGKPHAVIANTVKGKGFSFAENDNSWHHAVLTKKQYDLAVEELQSKGEI